MEGQAVNNDSILSKEQQFDNQYKQKFAELRRANIHNDILQYFLNEGNATSLKVPQVLAGIDNVLQFKKELEKFVENVEKARSPKNSDVNAADFKKHLKDVVTLGEAISKMPKDNRLKQQLQQIKDSIKEDSIKQYLSSAIQAILQKTAKEIKAETVEELDVFKGLTEARRDITGIQKEQNKTTQTKIAIQRFTDDVFNANKNLNLHIDSNYPELNAIPEKDADNNKSYHSAGMIPELLQEVRIDIANVKTQGQNKNGLNKKFNPFVLFFATLCHYIQNERQKDTLKIEITKLYYDYRKQHSADTDINSNNHNKHHKYNDSKNLKEFLLKNLTPDSALTTLIKNKSANVKSDINTVSAAGGQGKTVSTYPFTQNFFAQAKMLKNKHQDSLNIHSRPSTTAEKARVIKVGGKVPQQLQQNNGGSQNNGGPQQPQPGQPGPVNKKKEKKGKNNVPPVGPQNNNAQQPQPGPQGGAQPVVQQPRSSSQSSSQVPQQPQPVVRQQQNNRGLQGGVGQNNRNVNNSPLTSNKKLPIINGERVNRPQNMQDIDKLEGLDYKGNNIDTEILRKWLQDIRGRHFNHCPPFATYLFKPYIKPGLDGDRHKALYQQTLPIKLQDKQEGPERWKEYDKNIREWLENNNNWQDGKYTTFNLQVVDETNQGKINPSKNTINERNLLEAAEVFFKPTKTQKEIKDAIDTLKKLLPIAHDSKQWYGIGADDRQNRGEEIIALMHGLQLQQGHIFTGDVVGKKDGKASGDVDNRGLFNQMEDLLKDYIKNPEAKSQALKKQTEELKKIADKLGYDLGDVNKRDLIQFATFADFVEASLRKNPSKNDSEYKELLKHLDPVFASGDIFKEKDRTRALAELIALGDLDIVPDGLKETLAEKCKYFKGEIEEPLSTLITNHGTIAARAAVVHNQICDLKSKTIPKDLLDLYGKYKNGESSMGLATHFYDSRYNNPKLLNIKKQILNTEPDKFAGNDSLVAKTASLLGLKVDKHSPEDLKQKLIEFKTELGEFDKLVQPSSEKGVSTKPKAEEILKNQKKAEALLDKLTKLGLEENTELNEIAEYLQAIQQNEQLKLVDQEDKEFNKHSEAFLELTNAAAFAKQANQYADIARVAADKASPLLLPPPPPLLLAAEAAEEAAQAAEDAAYYAARASGNAARAKEVSSLVSPIGMEALLQRSNKLCSVASYAAANANDAAADAADAAAKAAADAAGSGATDEVIAHVYDADGVYDNCINAVAIYIEDFATRVNANIAKCTNINGGVLLNQERLEEYKKLEIELQQFKDHLKANEMDCFDDVLNQQAKFLKDAKTEYEAVLKHYQNHIDLQNGKLQPALQDRLKDVFGKAHEKIDEIIAAIDIEKLKKDQYEHALAIEQDEINKKDSLDLAFKANNLSTDVEESMLRLNSLLTIQPNTYSNAIANILKDLEVELQKTDEAGVKNTIETFFKGLPVPCKNDPYLKILKDELLGNIKGFNKKYGILKFSDDREVQNPVLQTIYSFCKDSQSLNVYGIYGNVEPSYPLTTAQSIDIIKQYAEEAKKIDYYYKNELTYPEGADPKNVENANNYRKFLVSNLELYKAVEDYGKDKDEAKYKAAAEEVEKAKHKIKDTTTGQLANLSEILNGDGKGNTGLIDLKKKHQNDLLKNAVIIKEIPAGDNLLTGSVDLKDELVVYKKSKDGFVKDDKHTGIKAPKAGDAFSVKLPDGKMLVLTAQKLNDGKVVLTDKYNRVYTVLHGKLYFGEAKDEEVENNTSTTKSQTLDSKGNITSTTINTSSSIEETVKTTQKFLSNGTLFEGTPLVLMDKKDNILLYQFCGCTLYTQTKGGYIKLTPDEYDNTFVIQNANLKVGNKLDNLIKQGIINTAVNNGDVARKRISQKTIEAFFDTLGLNNWQFAAASGLFIASLGVYVAAAKPTWIDTEVVNNNIMEYLKSTGVKITPEVQNVADDVTADLQQFQQQFDSLSADIKPKNNTLAEWQRALEDMNTKESFFTKDNITNYVEYKDGKLYFKLSNILAQKFSNRDGLSMLQDEGKALTNIVINKPSGPVDIMDGKTVAIAILAALFLIFAVGIIALANSDAFKHKEYSVITKDKHKNPKGEALITVQIQDDMEEALKEPKIVNKQIAEQIKEFIKSKAQDLALRIETNGQNEYILLGIDKLSPFEALILNKIVLPDLQYKNCLGDTSKEVNCQGSQSKIEKLYGKLDFEVAINQGTQNANYTLSSTTFDQKANIPLFSNSNDAFPAAKNSFLKDSFEKQLFDSIKKGIETEPETILDSINDATSTPSIQFTQEQKLNGLFKMGFAPVKKQLLFDVKIISKKISSGQGSKLIDLLLQGKIDDFVATLYVGDNDIDDIVKERFKQYLKDNEDKKKKLIAWIYTQLPADKQLTSDSRWTNVVGTTLRYALLAFSFTSLAAFVFYPQLALIVPNLLPAVLVILATFWALGRLFNYYKKNLEKEDDTAKTAIQILIGLGGVAAIGAIAFGIGSSVLSAGLSPILAMVACLIIMAVLKSAVQRITDTWNRNTRLNLLWLFVTPLGFDPGAFTLSDQNDKNIFRKSTFWLALLGASRLDVLKARTSKTSYAQVLSKRLAVILAITGAICFAAGSANAGIGLIAAALSLSILFVVLKAWLKKDTIKEAATKDWKSAIIPVATLASCAALAGVGIELAKNPQLLNNQWILLLLVVLCVLTVVLYSHFSNQNKTLEEKRHDAMEDFVKNKEPVLLRTTYGNEVVKAAEKNFDKEMKDLNKDNVNDLGEYTSTSTESISQIYHDQLANEAKDKGADKENGFVLFGDGLFDAADSKIKVVKEVHGNGNSNSKVIKSGSWLDGVKKIFTGRNP